MAAITTTVVATAATVNESRKSRKAAGRAADMQAEGVRNAQEEARAATQRAIPHIQGGFTDAISTVGGITGTARQPLQAGFASAQQRLNPLAQIGRGSLNEQAALLGLSGDEARQMALSRVSDPLQAEQERAFRRNIGALGATGGNALAQLAEMTRARTEANIGNRLQQLQSTGAPGLNAIQSQAQMDTAQGGALSDMDLNTQLELARLQAAQGTTLGNVEIGQGSELTQLAQNLGTARAGGPAFAAQQTPVANAINTGVGVFGAMGGFSTPPPNAGLRQNLFGRSLGGSAGTVNLGNS